MQLVWRCSNYASVSQSIVIILDENSLIFNVADPLQIDAIGWRPFEESVILSSSLSRSSLLMGIVYSWGTGLPRATTFICSLRQSINDLARSILLMGGRLPQQWQERSSRLAVVQTDSSFCPSSLSSSTRWSGSRGDSSDRVRVANVPTFCDKR